ncbi:MAG: hypothetical protein ACYTFT_13035 [Planctomycetota bacterium]
MSRRAMLPFALVCAFGLQGSAHAQDAAKDTPKGTDKAPVEELKPEERSRRATELYKQGVSLFQKGDLSAGISLLVEAKRLTPDYTLLRYDLGRLLLERARQLDSQAREAQDAAEADKLRALARTDYEGAVDDLGFVEGSDRFASANVPYFLAQALMGLERYTDGAEALSRALAHEEMPDDARVKLEEMRALLQALAAEQSKGEE